MTSGTWMLFRRETARYFNVWMQTIIPPIVSAALFLFVFGHALGGRIGTFGDIPYLTFLAPGLLIQGALTAAYSNTSSSLFDARRAGYIEDVLTSPLRDWQILLAYVGAAVGRAMLVGAITLLIALPVGGGWDINWPLFGLVLLLTNTAFALIGMYAGLTATRWDHVLVPVGFVLTPLTFLGGVFYPVSLLPADLAAASKWNPILYVVDLTRAGLLGVHDLPIASSLLVLTLFTAALAWIVYQKWTTSPKLRG